MRLEEPPLSASHLKRNMRTQSRPRGRNRRYRGRHLRCQKTRTSRKKTGYKTQIPRDYRRGRRPSHFSQSITINFFFLIDKRSNLLEKREGAPWYTGSIQGKHLTRNRKAREKVRKRNKQRMDISRSPTIQRMIEQRKSLFQGSFQVFKTSIVSFPPKAPEDTNRCHFPNNSTP